MLEFRIKRHFPGSALIQTIAVVILDITFTFQSKVGGFNGNCFYPSWFASCFLYRCQWSRTELSQSSGVNIRQVSWDKHQREEYCMHTLSTQPLPPHTLVPCCCADQVPRAPQGQPSSQRQTISCVHLWLLSLSNCVHWMGVRAARFDLPMLHLSVLLGNRVS